MNTTATTIIERAAEDISFAESYGTDSHYALDGDRIAVRTYDHEGALGEVIGYLIYQPVALGRSVHWAPGGDTLKATAGPVLRLLASADGTGNGFGYGNGTDMMFGTPSGEDIAVAPGQWVTVYLDGRVVVTDEIPSDASPMPI